MEKLVRPLEILSRAVHHKNLSAASRHVGLSQPQLSRLVRFIEEELNVVLLDRSTKRKSTWTPVAAELARTYHEAARRLLDSIHSVQEDYEAHQIHLACLEGLLEVGCQISHFLLTETKVRLVHLDVLDQTELEERFLGGDLDLILSSRNPGRGKPKYEETIGYQTLDWKGSGEQFEVMSPYEHIGRKRASHGPFERTFLSNSLAVRRLWLERYKGQGALPSAMNNRAQKESLPVMLLGHEVLPPTLWRAILTFLKSRK